MLLWTLVCMIGSCHPWTKKLWWIPFAHWVEPQILFFLKKGALHDLLCIITLNQSPLYISFHSFWASHLALLLLSAQGSFSLKNCILFLMSKISLPQISPCLCASSFPSVSSNTIFSETFTDHQWRQIEVIIPLYNPFPWIWVDLWSASNSSIQFSSVQSLSHVQLFATPWIAACQASLSITNSWSSLKLMSIKLVMPSSHLILCSPLLLLPPIPPSIRVFSSESTLRWGGQSTGVSALASVLAMNTQD